MNNLTRAKINSKASWFLTIIGIALLAYFIYEGFFASKSVGLDAGNNVYVSGTKQAKDYDIFNKENLNFNNTGSNIDQSLLNNIQDFSVTVDPSSYIGRDNPFIP